MFATKRVAERRRGEGKQKDGGLNEREEKMRREYKLQDKHVLLIQLIGSNHKSNKNIFNMNATKLNINCKSQVEGSEGKSGKRQSNDQSEIRG